jgi:hypothetical protein
LPFSRSITSTPSSIDTCTGQVHKEAQGSALFKFHHSQQTRTCLTLCKDWKA